MEEVAPEYDIVVLGTGTVYPTILEYPGLEQTVS
jgi:NADPH-dependent glutamate synthase beta subunit-like oxidoreductase